MPAGGVSQRGIHLFLKAVFLNNLISPDSGRGKCVPIFGQKIINRLTQGELCGSHTLLFQEAGTDGASAGFAEGGGVFGDALPFGPQLDVPFSGFQLPGLGDFEFRFLLSLTELLFTAPFAEDGIIANLALAIFALHNYLENKSAVKQSEIQTVEIQK